MEEEIRVDEDWARQIKRIEKEALYQLLHYQNRSTKQKCKDMAKRALRRYVPPEDMIFWPTGLLAGTLTENYDIWEDKDEVLSALMLYFDRWIERGMPLYYIDDLLCGPSLLDVYKITGEEKYKRGAGRMAAYLKDLLERESDKAGSLPYRPIQGNRHIYVDGLGMICPFLARYGRESGEDSLLEKAMVQVENMLKYGMDGKTGLPYHGYEYEKKVKYGIIGWGRAVGWMLLGMSGMLKNMEQDTEGYDKLSSEMAKLIVSAVKYQKENGAFNWQLEAEEGPEDSSSTAMIAKSLLDAVQYGMVKEENLISTCGKAVRRAAGFLALCEKDGKVYQCSGECLGFSQYPQIYGSYPWALGPGLAVLAGTYGGGIKA